MRAEKNNGFTIIELMIVIAIIAILAAIVIPKVIEGKNHISTTAAAQTLIKIHAAQMAARELKRFDYDDDGIFDFGNSWEDLPVSNLFDDEKLHTAGGYTFSFEKVLASSENNGNPAFVCIAEPTEVNASHRKMVIGENGKIFQFDR